MIETKEGGKVAGFYVRTRSGTLILTPHVVAELFEKQIIYLTATEGEYAVDVEDEDQLWQELRVT